MNKTKIPEKKIIKKIMGIVKSDQMPKTRVVEIIKKRRHYLYQKTYVVTSRIMAHDENNEFKTGDQVEIVETRPLSKNKAWKILGKIK